MTLIKSISGIRGTVGGRPGDNLTPIDIVRFTSAYAEWLHRQAGGKRLKVAVGRDARISGEMVKNIVVGTLQGFGIDVVHLGFATTPATELAVIHQRADGGLILTASHNPKQWNALKMLNHRGEFLSAADGAAILDIAEQNDFNCADVDSIGQVTELPDFIDVHVNSILALPLVDAAAIRKAGFKVAIDCVNSVGGVAIPCLLKALGVENILELYCEPSGLFPHNPEPLPEHLSDISELVRNEKADVGFVVDPDVDRLAIVNEDGSMFGEEYTLVSIADYVLSATSGNTVSNLSSTRALRDVTVKHGGNCFAAAVGEVNVVEQMKAVNAVIGGEGNGGVIYPALHYGRDALVGIALFLTLLAKKGKKCSRLRSEYPAYFMSKNKIELTQGIDVDSILLKIKECYRLEKITDIDGVKIDFDTSWVHLRKSNTEPIIRIYSEAQSKDEANRIALKIIDEIKQL